MTALSPGSWCVGAQSSHSLTLSTPKTLRLLRSGGWSLSSLSLESHWVLSQWTKPGNARCNISEGIGSGSRINQLSSKREGQVREPLLFFLLFLSQLLLQDAAQVWGGFPTAVKAVKTTNGFKRLESAGGTEAAGNRRSGWCRS